MYWITYSLGRRLCSALYCLRRCLRQVSVSDLFLWHRNSCSPCYSKKIVDELRQFSQKRTLWGAQTTIHHHVVSFFQSSDMTNDKFASIKRSCVALKVGLIHNTYSAACLSTGNGPCPTKICFAAVPSRPVQPSAASSNSGI